MANYDFTNSLSPLDFELLSKDLLEAELCIRLENFREGRDKGIDLRYAPQKGQGLIVQCKRYTTFANLKSKLQNEELPKIIKLKPARYILTTSVPLSPQQADELKTILSPFIQSTDNIFGRDRLNSILDKHPEVERRHIKLWVGSAGVLDSIVNAGTHIVSREEVERTIASAKVYVRNTSFDEALAILKKHHVCIISGLPGIGKTTLARMLLLYFYQREYDVVKIQSDISEARDVGYHNKPRFYYYDDFLGQTAQADKLNKNEDQKLLDFMCSIRDSKDSVLVLTTREYILNQAKLHYEKLDRENFDHRTCVIDLSKYSRRIRAQILYNHLHFSDLPRQHLECFVDSKGYVKVVDHDNYNPRLIEYLTSPAWVGETPSAQYLPLFIAHLDNPVQIWNHAFTRQLSQRARHLLFVLTTLPRETAMKDVEIAFNAFHNQQCDHFRIPLDAADFRSALKELDGTFVATQRIEESVLIRFQNPSIRDFMQNLLLNGELLTEIFKSLMFFEQAEWFAETLNDPNPQVPLQELARHARSIANCLQSLAETESCSVSVYTMGNQPRISRQPANPAMRLAKIARAVSNFKEDRDVQWIVLQVAALAEKLEARKVWAASCVAATKSLRELGYLDMDEGKRFISAMKSNASKDPSDLDDFETLAKVVKVLPRRTFSQSELDDIRESYSDFADAFSIDCGLSDPEEIREEASRIESVGDLLGVNTDNAQESLRETADEIQTKEEHNQDWDSDDESRGGGDASDECSDSELDSMFGTL
jgi:hypothetical protein